MQEIPEEFGALNDMLVACRGEEGRTKLNDPRDIMYYKYTYTIQNKNWLEFYYVELKKSLREIADIVGCREEYVEYWKKKFELKRNRLMGGKRPRFDGHEKLTYEYLYIEYVVKNRSAADIGRDFNVTDVTIRNYIRNCGIVIKNNSDCQKGNVLSDDTKKKISIRMRGENHPNYGRKWSPEVRNRMSIAKKGKYTGPDNHNYGKIYTEEERERLRGPNNPVFGKHWNLTEETKRKIARANIGKIVSSETRSKLSIAFMGKHVGPKNPNWRGGITFEPYCYKFNEEFKNRVRMFFDYRCVLCNKTTEENGNALNVHHVEYDKDACCTDQEFHFVILCNVCHTKTNFNRDRWMYIFEYIIKEIYNYKSYYGRDEITGRNV